MVLYRDRCFFLTKNICQSYRMCCIGLYSRVRWANSWIFLPLWILLLCWLLFSKCLLLFVEANNRHIQAIIRCRWLSTWWWCDCFVDVRRSTEWLAKRSASWCRSWGGFLWFKLLCSVERVLMGNLDGERLLECVSFVGHFARMVFPNEATKPS